MKYLLILALMFPCDAVGKSIHLPNKATLKHIYNAAKRYHLNVQDMLKIAFLESSFNSEARRVNKNNTIDYGLFQINSVHWSTTCKEYDIFSVKGNSLCAAKLLAGFKRDADIDEHWIGKYHSKTKSKKIAYANKIAVLNIEDVYFGITE